jgi:hypothetical protein
MKKPSNKSSIIKENSNSVNWKKRPSEIRGYKRTFYTDTENGDYFRLDYNPREKKVRIFIEDSEEGGNPYFSIVTDGKVTLEKNATSGRSTDLFSKFSKRADILKTVPSDEVLAIILNVYNIGKSIAEEKERKERRRQELERTRKKYFKPEDYEGPDGDVTLRTRINLTDIFDMVIGVSACAGFFYFDRNFIILAMISATFGIIIGLVDMFIRSREPVFSKMILFILAGLCSFVYGYYLQ